MPDFIPLPAAAIVLDLAPVDRWFARWLNHWRQHGDARVFVAEDGSHAVAVDTSSQRLPQSKP